MAISHIQINPQLPHASRLRSVALGIENDVDVLTEELGTMALMIDGDPSVAANYGEVVTRYGIETPGMVEADRLAAAKALFDEMNSLKFKLTTNASVSDVNAAILQAASKIR